MRRIAARTVIATMADNESVWDRADRNQVGRSMASHLVAAQRYATVTEFPAAASHPFPALIQIAYIDTRPKPFDLFRGKLSVRHCWTSLTGRVVRRAGSVDALPGFPLPELYQLKAG
jgi:hypothetical protein